MGTLFSSLDIARLGLKAAQVQLDVAAHNIANVNTRGYSRQRVSQSTPLPTAYSFGQIGRGVTIAEIRRVRDEFLDRIYRNQVSGLGNVDVQSQYYTLIEDAYLEPSDDGFGTRVNAFFDALNDLANSVEETPVREAVLAEGVAMADAFRSLTARLDLLRTNANEEIRNIVPEINRLAQTISETNRQVRDAELDNSVANDLRDERDRALDDLARLVNISYTERADGQVTVRVGADVLVDETGAREIEGQLNSTLDPERGDLLEIRFVDNGRLLDVRDGELSGALRIRDEVIPGLDARMDTLAATIIERLNRIHAQGAGLTPLSGAIVSSVQVDDADAPLASAGLPFVLTVPGAFDIVLYDADGDQLAGSPFTVTVDASTSLNGLIAQINGLAPGSLSAALTADGRLELTAATGVGFRFANDTSNALTALGVNGFLTGRDARTIAVNQALLDNPEWLSTGYDLDASATGDNSAALDMADVRNQMLLDNGASTINDYYESTVARLGVESRGIQVSAQTELQFTTDFERRRQEVSGVSLDEEATFLIQYQRAYEASARVITTAERMLDALFTMAQ